MIVNEDVAAARLLLARLGVTPERLLGATPPTSTPTIPSVRQYIADVSVAVPPSTRRVYETYWRRIAEAWGDRPLDEITSLDIGQLTEQTRTHLTLRRNSRGGRSAAEHLIAALGCVYRHAVADGLITEAHNPAIRVARPRRLPSTRRALPDAGLAEIKVAMSAGNDPDPDSLLLRLHIETACRRGGALALRPVDLDATQCLVRLREKGETVRWQPVSPTLIARLLDHARERTGPDDEPLLRYRNGTPVTARRYDHLWIRVRRHLPWVVAAQQVSTHWLRHTTLTWVERNCGYAVARAYAGQQRTQ